MSLKAQGRFSDPSWQHTASIWCVKVYAVKRPLKIMSFELNLTLTTPIRVVAELEPGGAKGQLAAKSRYWQKTAEFPPAPASLPPTGAPSPRCPLGRTTSKFIHFQEKAQGLLGPQER